MPPWLTALLGRLYKHVPSSARPLAKQTFVWGFLRTQAVTGRRSVEHGTRIQFLDFEIAHLEPYEFLGPSAADVLVEAHYSTVSPGTERAVLCGLPGARRPFPYTPGYSTAGVVRKAGAGSGLSVGDRVAGRMSHASHGLMSKTSLFKVPDSVHLRDASFMELGIICLQGIRKARLKPGQRVAVIGMGLIGQLAARLARIAGAGPIVAVAASKRRAAASAGYVDEFIALNETPDALATLNADVVIEAVGSAKGIVQAMGAVRPGGTVVLLGSSRDLGRGLDWWRLAQERGITLVGAHISNMPGRDASATLWTYEQEGRLFLDLLASGQLTVRDLITWTAPPDDCNKVYEVIGEGGREHVGIVFAWAEPPAAG